MCAFRFPPPRTAPTCSLKTKAKPWSELVIHKYVKYERSLFHISRKDASLKAHLCVSRVSPFALVALFLHCQENIHGYTPAVNICVRLFDVCNACFWQRPPLNRHPSDTVGFYCDTTAWRTLALWAFRTELVTNWANTPLNICWTVFKKAMIDMLHMLPTLGAAGLLDPIRAVLGWRWSPPWTNTDRQTHT